MTDAEAMALANQPGVRLEWVSLPDDFGEGDVTLRFNLPDGRRLMYRSFYENDPYYDGGYHRVAWWMEEP